MLTAFESVAGLLEHRAGSRGDQTAFDFRTGSGEKVSTTSVSFDGLFSRVQAVADALQDLGLENRPLLLAYPPGLEFVEAFLACLCAGAIAVPVPFPSRSSLKRTIPRLRGIAADCSPAAVLTTSAGLGMAEVIGGEIASLSRVFRVATDNVESASSSQWRVRSFALDTLALLQYTSGSTGEPKGVMVSHRNLLTNTHDIQLAMGLGETSRGVSWLPHFHDMGLVGAVILPLQAGCRFTLMSPMSFLRRPLDWLKTISDVGASYSPAPNFAYELCARTPTDVPEGLDLRKWRIACTGAEPIRASTLERFCSRFGPYGFQRSMFFPRTGLPNRH